ncbi:hypothetical protein DMN91_003508 [Ooceraea biroi]|uniref:Uncharacterized protein n=1 Tax=Ooceraea biroi TaxID=2015173 RepID=A0A3L8DSB7_OOCBI|nr:hypothetical protein DMN91_003508 [Ooceraea biroi]
MPSWYRTRKAMGKLHHKGQQAATSTSGSERWAERQTTSDAESEASVTSEASLHSKGKKRGRPPTTGEYIELAQAKKQATAVEKEKAEWKREQAFHDRTEAILHSVPRKHRGKLEEYRETLRANPTADIVATIVAAMGVVEDVETTSLNLKGTYQNALKDVAMQVRLGMSVLTERGASGNGGAGGAEGGHEGPAGAETRTSSSRVRVATPVGWGERGGRNRGAGAGCGKFTSQTRCRYQDRALPLLLPPVLRLRREEQAERDAASGDVGGDTPSASVMGMQSPPRGSTTPAPEKGWEGAMSRMEERVMGRVEALIKALGPPRDLAAPQARQGPGQVQGRHYAVLGSGASSDTAGLHEGVASGGGAPGEEGQTGRRQARSGGPCPPRLGARKGGPWPRGGQEIVPSTEEAPGPDTQHGGHRHHLSQGRPWEGDGSAPAGGRSGGP